MRGVRVVKSLASSILPVAGLVFYTLSLTGCVSNSPGLPNVFLVALSGSGDAELRVGYFGMCLHRNGSQTCAATPYTVSPQALHSALSLGLAQEDGDSLLSTPILSTALQLQRSIFFGFEIFAGLIFLFSLFLFLIRIHIQMSARARQEWRFITQRWPENFLVVSVAISLANVVSVTQTGNGLEFATHKFSTTSLVVKAGHVLQILEWLAFGFSAIFYVVMIKGTSSSKGFSISDRERLDDGSPLLPLPPRLSRPGPAFLGPPPPPLSPPP